MKKLFKQIKFSRKIKIKIDLTTLKARRFFMGAFFFTAGADFERWSDYLLERDYWMAVIPFLFMCFFLHAGIKERRRIEGDVGVDQYLEGYKHGLSTRNGR